MSEISCLNEQIREVLIFLVAAYTAFFCHYLYLTAHTLTFFIFYYL